MFIWLSAYLSQYFHFFNVFQYITLRAILATLTALLITLVIGPRMIQKLNAYNLGQPIRDDGPQSHFSKAGTPTMGGALILIAMTASSLLWSNLSNHFVLISLFCMNMFGFIGWVDDYQKLIKKNSKGLSAKNKYFWQSFFGLSAVIFIYFMAQTPAQTALLLPFFKYISIPLGVFFIPWAYLVIVGSSNAVNLTDGLDGLAILPTVLVGGALGIFAYVTGHSVFAHYLNIPYIANVGELAVLCGTLVGAGLGFLWFNTYPAMIIMGDVGALGLGALLGCIAVLIRQELILFLMGGIFVIETLSVILQVASFKITGKRIFRMAPLHHHFELKGWPEPRVIVRFWIITVVLVLLGLASLKLR